MAILPCSISAFLEAPFSNAAPFASSSGPVEWLFHEPPAESKVPAAQGPSASSRFSPFRSSHWRPRRHSSREPISSRLPGEGVFGTAEPEAGQDRSESVDGRLGRGFRGRTFGPLAAGRGGQQGRGMGRHRKRTGVPTAGRPIHRTIDWRKTPPGIERGGECIFFAVLEIVSRDCGWGSRPRKSFLPSNQNPDPNLCLRTPSFIRLASFGSTFPSPARVLARGRPFPRPAVSLLSSLRSGPRAVSGVPRARE